jgi:hypothetical protein
LLALVRDRLARGLRQEAAGVEGDVRAADRVVAVGPGVIGDPVQRPGVLAIEVRQKRPGPWGPEQLAGRFVIGWLVRYPIVGRRQRARVVQTGPVIQTGRH